MYKGIERLSAIMHTDRPGKPHVEVYRLPQHMTMLGETIVTSVIIDNSEFDNILDKLSVISPQISKWKELIDYFRHMKAIPAIVHDDAIQWLYNQFNVTTRVLCILVRGESSNLARKFNFNLN